MSFLTRAESLSLSYVFVSLSKVSPTSYSSIYEAIGLFKTQRESKWQ